MKNDLPSTFPIQDKRPEWLPLTMAARLLSMDSQAILDFNELGDYPALKQETDGEILVKMIDLNQWYRIISDECKHLFHLHYGTSEERYATRLPPEIFQRRSIGSEADQGVRDA